MRQGGIAETIGKNGIVEDGQRKMIGPEIWRRIR